MGVRLAQPTKDRAVAPQRADEGRQVRHIVIQPLQLELCSESLCRRLSTTIYYGLLQPELLMQRSLPCCLGVGPRRGAQGERVQVAFRQNPEPCL